jgi:hypothetical protein
MNKTNEIHLCLKAPNDFLAWRRLACGQVCQYCGFMQPRRHKEKEEQKC